MADETPLSVIDDAVVTFKSESTLPAATAPDPVITPDPEPKATEVQADSVPEEDAPAKDSKKKPWFQERINELTREKHDALRELERLKAEKTAINPSLPAGERPKLEDFDFDTETYTAAVAEWTVKRVREAEQAEIKKVQEVEHQNERASQFKDRLAQFEERAPGVWQKVITTDMPTPPELLEIVQARPAGFELAAYLAENVEEAREIAALSPTLRAAEYAVIERSLRSEKTEKAIPPKPLVTRAPPPVPTLKPKASIQIPSELMTPEDRIRQWRAEGKFKRRP